MSEDEREQQGDSDAGDAALGLPLVPPEVEVDPLLVALVHAAALLDMAGDDVIDPDVAGDALDRIGLYVQRLPPERIEELSSQLSLLGEHAERAGWPEWMSGFVREFLYSCGIGEDEDEDEDEAS